MTKATSAANTTTWRIKPLFLILIPVPKSILSEEPSSLPKIEYVIPYVKSSETIHH